MLQWPGRWAGRVSGPWERSHPLKVRMDPLRLGLKAQSVYSPGGGERRVAGSSQSGAKVGQASADAAAVLLVRRGSKGVAATEGVLPAAGRRRGRTPVSSGPHGEVDGEDGELSWYVRVVGSTWLGSDAEVPVLVSDHRSAEEF